MVCHSERSEESRIKWIDATMGNRREMFRSAQHDRLFALMRWLVGPGDRRSNMNLNIAYEIIGLRYETGGLKKRSCA
jgi:hypothetical protein